MFILCIRSIVSSNHVTLYKERNKLPSIVKQNRNNITNDSLKTKYNRLHSIIQYITIE